MEAVEFLKTNASINLILMDLQMPVIDGMSATQIIRKISEYQDVPVIAMSANINQQTMDECLKIGMNGFVNKPFDRNILLTVINQNLKIQE